ncbi:hypothetical protein [Geoalkalibacter sp.]|uniref:hypothetical protein n=1 Tax=Geoalkalibacter sp. TaxID=3041440 RepID=UPI00272ED5BE|nr:hypothetical protein [Geoalkalibacter sp.]
MTFAPKVIEALALVFHRQSRIIGAAYPLSPGLGMTFALSCFHPLEEGAGIPSGLPMLPNDLDFLQDTITMRLESIFGVGTVDPHLPELVEQLSAWIISELAPALSPETFRNICDAVAFLYPPSPAFPYNPTEEPPADAEPPSWRRVAALLRLWALLVSEDARAAFSYVCDGDFSLLENSLAVEGFADPFNERTKLTFIAETIELICQAKDDVLRAEVAKPITPLGRREIIQAAKQWEAPDPFGDGYDLLYSRLLLAIDPNHDLESILAAVRQVVQACHDEMRRSHAANWNDEERLFYGDEYIDGLDPVKGFTHKARGDKGRKVQTFAGEAVEALLVFALRQIMTPAEINERFFPSWPNDTDAATRPKAKRNTDRYNLAIRLIRNAKSGVAIQS